MASKIVLQNNLDAELEISHSDNFGALKLSSKELGKVKTVDTVYYMGVRVSHKR